jgi:hypothetical protein
MIKGKCVPYNSRKDKVSVVLGIIISVASIIFIALMVGVAVYWKKSRTKQRLNVGIPVYWKKFTTKQRLNKGLEIT